MVMSTRNEINMLERNGHFTVTFDETTRNNINYILMQLGCDDFIETGTITVEPKTNNTPTIVHPVSFHQKDTGKSWTGKNHHFEQGMGGSDRHGRGRGGGGGRGGRDNHFYGRGGGGGRGRGGGHSHSEYGSGSSSKRIYEERGKEDGGKEVGESRESKESRESGKPVAMTQYIEKDQTRMFLDNIRMQLNKLTDKTYDTIKAGVIKQLQCIPLNEETQQQIAMAVYEISSTNKFFSHIFAQFYTEVSSLFPWLKPTFEEQYEKLLAQFISLEEDKDEGSDFERLCRVTKTNERRRAYTMFFLNLSKTNFVSQFKVIDFLHHLVTELLVSIDHTERRLNADEFVENIILLYDKELFQGASSYEKAYINSEPLLSIINRLGHSKLGSFPGLSTKSVFKMRNVCEGRQIV